MPPKSPPGHDTRGNRRTFNALDDPVIGTCHVPGMSEKYSFGPLCICEHDNIITKLQAYGFQICYEQQNDATHFVLSATGLSSK